MGLAELRHLIVTLPSPKLPHQIPSIFEALAIHSMLDMRAKYFLIGLLGLAAIGGCGGSVTTRGVAQIRAISAVTNPARLVVFTDFNIIGSDMSVGDVTGYGNQTATLMSIGARQFGTTQTLASVNLEPAVGEKFTILPFQNTLNSIGILVFQDGAAAPAAGKFKVRLGHVARLTGNVDLYVVGPGANLSQETPVATNLAFQNATGYLELTAGQPREIILTQTGTVNQIGNSIALTPAVASIRTLVLLESNGPKLNIYED
jgi:hypothetical protein